MSAERSGGTLLAIGECMIEMSGGQEGDGSWRLGFAGDTVNALWCARALLDPAEWRTAFYTRVGRDRMSDRMLAFLERAGIDASLATRDPERLPGLYAIELADGERSFSYWRDSSAARRLADDEAALDRALAAADAVYLSGITLAILAPDRRAALIERIAAATRAGTLTAFDPNIRPRLWESLDAAREAVTAAAGASAVALPSFEDEASVFGDATPEATAARYRAAGAREIVVKDGAGPALVEAGDGRVSVPALGDARVVDTTGAGDSFNGAYLALRLTGAGPEAAAHAGHAAAGETIGHFGALAPVEALREAVRAAG